jgi:serine/threonine protein kinase
LGRPTHEDIQSLDSVVAKECINQISAGKKKSFTSSFSSMDAEAMDLLRKLLVFNPAQRYTAE